MPANFQKRAFPFQIDGVRAPGLRHLNMNIDRTVRLPANKTLQFRVDALNVFSNETYDTPSLNPTSTRFGMVTANNGHAVRFFTPSRLNAERWGAGIAGQKVLVFSVSVDAIA